MHAYKTTLSHLPHFYAGAIRRHCS